MKLPLLLLLASLIPLSAEIPVIAGSKSPDGKLHAVIDIDRDSSIEHEWKGDSFPKIEITETDRGKILDRIEYTGTPGDDGRPLREHVSLKWRRDSKAFAVTIRHRFYSNTSIYVFDQTNALRPVEIPGYEELTGRPAPSGKI